MFGFFESASSSSSSLSSSSSSTSPPPSYSFNTSNTQNHPSNTSSVPRASVLNFISSVNCKRIVILTLCLHIYSTCLSFSSSFIFTLRLLLFLFNLVYCIAFFSLFIQVEGLLGMESGILPINEEGINTFKNREDISTNFLLYLSFRYHGREFLTFQWDVLLLESGILCIIGSLCICTYSSFSANICICSFRLLLFKLMFSSGICKYASGCPQWASNCAMNFHFWTQPLPNAFSWTCYWMKNKNLMCIASLIAECFIPFCIFCSKSMRLFSFFVFTGLMLSIYLTGNYGFFNILVFVLSFSLFDDNFFNVALVHPQTSIFGTLLSSIVSLIIFLITLIYFSIYTIANIVPLYRVWRRNDFDPPKFCFVFYLELSPIHACNVYGLFATMTTYRHEIVIEELHKIDNKMEWVEINFKYKPGDINKPPINLWNGHMPRLDWRIWFIPLRINKMFNLCSPSSIPSSISSTIFSSAFNLQNKTLFQPEDYFPFFFKSFLVHLIKRTSSVMQLLGNQKYDLVKLGTPKSLRVSLFDYRFATSKQLPIYSSFFPNGMPALSESDLRELHEELKNWEIGAWWIRKRIKILEVLNFKMDNREEN